MTNVTALGSFVVHTKILDLNKAWRDWAPAWSDTISWREGRWWVTFQNDVVELTLASEDFMQFGVTKRAGEELRMRAEAKASQVKSHDAIKQAVSRSIVLWKGGTHDLLPGAWQSKAR